MPSTLFKKEFHLTADNEQEVAGNENITSYVDISRSGIQILKSNQSFKALEFISYKFPFSSSNNIWASRVSDLITSEEFLKETSSYKSVYSLSSAELTLVPKAIFDSEKAAASFEFLFGSEDVVIEHRFLSNSDMVGVFAVPKLLAEISTQPIDNSVLLWIDHVELGGSLKKAYVIINERKFYLCVTGNKEMMYFNSFDYSNTEDVLYFLMASLEKLNILHSEIEISLGGTITKGDDMYNSIAKFLGTLNFQKRPTNLQYSYSFGQLPEQRFPFIFAAACA